jgi:hypothetical protein
MSEYLAEEMLDQDAAALGISPAAKAKARRHGHGHGQRDDAYRPGGMVERGGFSPGFTSNGFGGTGWGCTS